MQNKKPQKNAPSGTWNSPISALQVSRKFRFDDVRFHPQKDSIVWVEGRSDRGVLVLKDAASAARDLTVELNVRGRVGYGGGEFVLTQDKIIFAEKDGRLYTQDLLSGNARPLTPPWGYAASPTVSAMGKWVVYVFSDGKEDCLGMVALQGNEWPLKLASGADFYMNPVCHPLENSIAWMEWNHPNMPWDGARIVLAKFQNSAPYLAETKIIAGKDNNPAAQPHFSPDGRYLAFIEWDGEWDSLKIYDVQTGEIRILASDKGAMIGEPDWVQGLHTFDWMPDSLSLIYRSNRQGFASLWQVDLRGNKQKIDTGEYTWLSQISVHSQTGAIACIASSASIPDRIIRIHSGSIQIEAYSDPERISPEYFSTPRPLSWKSKNGQVLYGLFYPPQNADFFNESLPPAIINIHGGPTSQRAAGYSAETAFFTSRGYACLDLNYRGSSGYGKEYQSSLNGAWGEADVDDSIAAAQALVEMGLADGNRLVIRGGSAGGYTVLNVLVRAPGVFRAGINLYGVSDLFLLARDTHKFEQHYQDRLVGVLPESAARYRAWSPGFHASEIKDAIAIFQGSIDPVVPPSQSENIVKILKENGVRHFYRLYEGEGHGFRKTENIQDYVEQTEKFLLDNIIYS